MAIATPATYVKNPLSVFELDFEENLRVIRQCVKYQKRVIFPSTSEVYGDPAILMPLIHPVEVKPPAQRSHDFGVASMVLDPPLAIPPGAAPINARV